MSLQDLFDMFEEQMAHDHDRVACTKTAIGHAARAFGVTSPSEIPVSAFERAPSVLATYLREKDSSERKLRNNKSLLKRLIDWGRDRGLVPMFPSHEVLKSWQATIEACRSCLGNQGAFGWNALGKWSSSRGLHPSDLTYNDLVEFTIWLQMESGYKRWREMYHFLERTYREASHEGKVPPLTFPSLPQKKPSYRLPFQEWPSRMQKDYQEYRNWATAEFMPGRPRKNKQREVTATGTLSTLQRIAGYFTNICENPKNELDFLTFLDKDLITGFVSWLSSERKVAKTTILKYVQALLPIGLRYLRFEKKDLAWLGELVEQLLDGEPADKSEKMVSYDQLLSVPDRLRRERIALKQKVQKMQQRRRKPNPKRLALIDKRLALMHTKEFIIRFAIVTVLRTRNILEATLDKNVKKGTDGTWRIHFGSEETKTSNVIAFSLPSLQGRYLEEYVNDARRVFAPDGDSKRLFLSSKGKPLYRDALRRIVRSVCLRYFGKAFTPHCIRNVVATGLKKKGVDILVISKILGHKDINTTLRNYIHCDMDEAMTTYHDLLHSMFDSVGSLAEKNERAQAETSPESAQTVHPPKHPEKRTAGMPESIPRIRSDRQVDKEKHGLPVDGRASKPSGQAKPADRACQSPVQKPSQNRQPPKAGSIPLRAKHLTRKIPRKTSDDNQSDVSGQLSLFRCESLDENSKDGHTC